MRTIVSGQHAASPQEFAELALGIDTELFTGPAGVETPDARAARLAAAADILDDLRREDPDLAAHATRLMDSASAFRQPMVHLLIGGIPRRGKSGACPSPLARRAA